jgi:hypothetical protein
MPRCAAKKEDGSPCERIVGASQPYCYSHEPVRAAERRRNASRGGRSKANAEIAGLKAQLRKLAADERKIKETEELEARLEALEVVLKARRSG